MFYKKRKKSCLIKCWCFSVILKCTSYFWESFYTMFSVYLFFLWCFLIQSQSSTLRTVWLFWNVLLVIHRPVSQQTAALTEEVTRLWQLPVLQPETPALVVVNFSSVLTGPSPAPFFRLLILRGDTLFRLNARFLVVMYY